MDEYKSATEEEKSGNEEDKSASDNDDKQISCDEEEAIAETSDIKKEEIQNEPVDMQESVPSESVEIPLVIKTEKLEIEPMEELLAQDESLLPVVKSEPVDTEVPFEDVTCAPVIQTELAVETSLPTSVKMESIEVVESDYLHDTTIQEGGLTPYQHSETDFTNVCNEEIDKTEEEVQDAAILLDSLDVMNDNANLIVGVEKVNDDSDQLEGLDEVLSSVQESIETTELAEALEETNSPAPELAPRTDEEVESRDQLINGETATILDPLISISQTPTVNSSLDGNVEMTNKQPAPAPQAGIKIKINLFNKASSTISSTAQQVTPQISSQPDAGLTSCPANVPDNSSKLLIPTSDENSLTYKPRLAGRKLTVLPLMTKGVETSGLCSIM